MAWQNQRHSSFGYPKKEEEDEERGVQGPLSLSCPCKKLPYYLSSFTAAEHGDVHSLFRRGADAIVNRQDAAGNTPLHLAAQHGHVAATAALLAAGCNVNGYVPATTTTTTTTTTKERRSTPLHRASFSGAVGTMRLLIQHESCDLLAKDTSFGDDMTPLHKAVSGGRPLAVQLLLEAHAQRQQQQQQQGTRNSFLTQALQARDANGRTALELAESKCPNRAAEMARVARWDVVAGTAPDWEACATILRQIAQQQQQQQAAVPDKEPETLNHHTTTTSSSKTATTTTTTKPLNSADCWNCGSEEEEDAVCRTASWERSFWNALHQNTMAALHNNNNNNSTKDSSSLFVASAKETTELASPFYTPVPLLCLGTEEEEHAAAAAATRKRQGAQSRGDRNVRDAVLGAICGNCGKRTIALYPVMESGKKRVVCKQCRQTLKRKPNLGAC